MTPRGWRCRGRRREIGQPNGAKSNFHLELGFRVGELLPFILEDYSYQLA
jgi:hypothetical protein